jgi:hypothetical protein
VSNRITWSIRMDDTHIQACFGWIQSIQLNPHVQVILHVQPTLPPLFLPLPFTEVQTVHLGTRPLPLLYRRYILRPLMSLTFKKPFGHFLPLTSQLDKNLPGARVTRTLGNHLRPGACTIDVIVAVILTSMQANIEFFLTSYWALRV